MDNNCNSLRPRANLKFTILLQLLDKDKEYLHHNVKNNQPISKEELIMLLGNNTKVKKIVKELMEQEIIINGNPPFVRENGKIKERVIVQFDNCARHALEHSYGKLMIGVMDSFGFNTDKILKALDLK